MKHIQRIWKQFSAHRLSDFAVLGLGLALFATLCFATIAKGSIWFDEGFSYYITQFSFADIAQYTAVDVHPPLYYWILKLWEMVAGTGEVALRSLSVLFGGSAITFGFLLVRRLFGRKAAWVSLLFLALSPMLIRYGQEARMYTLTTTIVLAATYVLTFALETKKKLLWIVYGLLVAAGLWVHYFSAVVWFAHWVWRAFTIRRGKNIWQYITTFFSKEWIIAHCVALAAFAPWLPWMITQLTVIQTNGFWIGPVTIDSPLNYLSNVFYYLEHHQVAGWLALLLGVIIGVFIWLSARVYRSLSAKDKKSYLLIVAIAFIPVIALLLASMPPLKSSFVERYLIPSAATTALFLGVTVVLAGPKLKLAWRWIVAGLVVLAFAVGITNVYHYGNYNKNSQTNIQTRDVIRHINEVSAPGEPIISLSPWVFYEAAIYNSDRNPIYFLDEKVNYVYGSLEMLQKNDQHKIKDLDEFVKAHPVVWLIDNSSVPLTAPRDAWASLGEYIAPDHIDGKQLYRGGHFRVVGQ